MKPFAAGALTLALVAVAACDAGLESAEDAPATTAAEQLESAEISEGRASSQDIVSEWYAGLVSSDLARMWSILDPELKPDIRRAAWDACIAVKFPERSDVSFDYEETEVFTEDGAVFSGGSIAFDGGFDNSSNPLTFEVVERAGEWFAVGPVTSEGDGSCLESSR